MTTIVWLRNDLRVHDNPALFEAANISDHVIPVFIFNDSLTKGRHAGSNRNRFLLESLSDLKGSLQGLGANLIVRHGDPSKILIDMARQYSAEAVFYARDYSLYAVRRDDALASQLEGSGIDIRVFSGRLVMDNPDGVRSKTGTIYKVFTPFYKSWSGVKRREVLGKPKAMSLPSGIEIGSLPSLDELTKKTELSTDVLVGGETEGRKRLRAFMRKGVEQYHENHNDPAADKTSRLSAYIHFGCLSPREIEEGIPRGQGPDAWRRQLAWRDFYHYVLLNFPENTHEEYQERFRKLEWGSDENLLKAWQEGKTGYPIIDAAMRQLNQEGWMHNRARLIVGSFLTKDLWLDWRLGETYFMRMLIDGDEANNNGNWQWIASVGVDPAPVFRRLYNPVSQAKTYDPAGGYIRRYVPELKNVPDKYIAEPWAMSDEDAATAGVVIGKTYPERIVDHAEARTYALEQYRSA